MKTFFHVDDVAITDSQLFLIAGPCVIESEAMAREIAAETKRIAEELQIPFIFKASFDKANRSSIESFRGPGLKDGLRILGKIKQDFGIPVLSDIHESGQAEPAAEVLSAIQIPAFLSRQTDILQAAGKTGLPIQIKKSQFMAPEDMRLAARKVEETGNRRILLCERGTFFGYNNLVVDFRGIPAMVATGYPVVMDASHSVQKPTAAGGVSGGDPEFIPLMARAGIVSGAHGLFLEVHPQPTKALSDRGNSFELKKLKSLLSSLQSLYNIG
jgi:2-dehydro-3-deoxyphosphooctonate aldolase (KDO 8-P synthase)